MSASLRSDTQFATAVLTWREQRQFTANAIAALPPNSPLARAISKETTAILGFKGSSFSTADFVDTPRDNVLCGPLSFDAILNDGSIQAIRTASGSEMSGPWFKVW